MKTKTIILIATFAIGAFLLARVSGKPIHRTCDVAAEGSLLSAIKVSQHDFESLTSAYQANHPTRTFGGTLSKAEVQNLINSMPSGSQLVTFRFCTDPVFRKLSMALYGAKTPEQRTSDIRCLRNGGSAAAFCPTSCELNATSTSNTLSITPTEFETLTLAYQTLYPTRTLGGRIDKAALQDIINSLGSANKNISFRICTDLTFNKNSVIFVGGAVNQAEDQVLYMRNGLNADSFCPTNCTKD